MKKISLIIITFIFIGINIKAQTPELWGMAGTTIFKTINISNLSKGLYFLQVQTEKGIGVKRFIKE
jgi:hypothetical protein